MNDPIAALERVEQAYDEGRVVALRDVSLWIARGESLAIVGPSGSGKSTLLHVLCGMERPTRGRVLFEGRALSVREWTRVRAERIGFVFQAFHLLPTLTALENVEVPMFGTVRRARERRRRALALLEQVGLAGRAGHRPHALSGGERQRVAIARSLANAPDLILADEPTGNLDSEAAAGVVGLLLQIRAVEARTLVLVTHNRELARLADRQVGLLDGRIASDEPRSD